MAAATASDKKEDGIAKLLLDGVLTPVDAEQLEKNRFVISRTELKQSFSAYIEGAGQSFVTADAVLNAYHVLFEESLHLQEQAVADHLRIVIREVLRKLVKTRTVYQGSPALVEAAYARACFTIGVAAGLFELDLSVLPAGLRVQVDSELVRIRREEGLLKPALLGEPEPSFEAFDYTAFRPAGFYDRSAVLQRYFRAVRWLQLVPFRSDRHEEMLAFDMIILALQEEPGHDFSINNEADFARTAFYDHSYAFSGIGFPQLGGVIMRKMEQYKNRENVQVGKEFLDGLVEEFVRDFKTAGNVSPAKDRVRQPPGAEEAEIIEARLLPSFVLPEQKALRRCMDETPGPPPGSLEVAAWLDHPFAISLLRDSPQKDRLQILRAEKDAADFQEAGGGAVWNYLGALHNLGVIDTRAPAFMKSEPWQRKSLMTVAASWAQHRHAWSLQSRLEIHYMGLTAPPEAFVEPVPAFFERLAYSCEQMAESLSRMEALISPQNALMTELDGMIELLSHPPDDDLQVMSLYERLATLQFMLGVTTDMPAILEKPRNTRDYKPVVTALKSLRARISTAEPGLVSQITKQRRAFVRETSREWSRLASVCLRLALIAQRQLDGKEHTNRDKAWLGSIGEVLAKVMLYDGNSYLTPRDDAPRIARISSNPRTGGVFHAGIGRPRVMYVLYPSQGKEFLCRGVVLPYHELSTDKSMTDSEWMEQFKGDERPPVPSWLSKLIPLDEVKLDEKE